MNEFDLIRNYFRPLAATFPGSLNLQDDAALLTPPVGTQLVATADALVAGVHFFGNEDAALIARKALRTNLSDLAAMGAAPYAYLLTLALPTATPEAWVARFAEGLAADQAEFGIALAGGDTVTTPGVLTISITALGTVPIGAALTRSGTRVGDGVYVSGTLGDAALGLRCMKGELPPNEFLQQRYLLPQPRLKLGEQLRGKATACMDISDGLVQDLGHICAASHVGAVIHTPLLPLSPTAKKAAQAMQAALTGGDDYELLFTLPPGVEIAADVAVTRIGEIVAGNGVRVLDDAGRDVTPASGGFRHTLG